MSKRTIFSFGVFAPANLPDPTLLPLPQAKRRSDQLPWFACFVVNSLNGERWGPDAPGEIAMELVVKEFDEEHITAALSLWERTEHIGLSASDSPQQLSQFLRRNPSLSFVAFLNGELVGAVLCGHDGRRGYIHHLAVAPETRQSGIGTTLLSKCLSSLQQAGILKCHAFVFHTNEYGDLFWRRLGWDRRDDLQMYSIDIDGQRVDAQ